jgi:hypothetical protein
MLHRRALLAAPAAALAPLANPARAQGTWPDRPLRVIVASRRAARSTCSRA